MEYLKHPEDLLKVALTVYGKYIDKEEFPLAPTRFLVGEEIMKEYKNAFSVTYDMSDEFNSIEFTLTKPLLFFIRKQPIIIDSLTGCFQFEIYRKNPDGDASQIMGIISNMFDDFFKSKTGSSLKIIEAMSKRVAKIADVCKRMNLPFYKSMEDYDFKILYSRDSKELSFLTKKYITTTEKISDDISDDDLSAYSNPTEEEVLRIVG